ncbi:class F sortase [Amycolatopsis arida]|uniref:class F sortase n=1 Tax=Amycolatopsis arida TaxID=587909 RepID=UPI001FBBC096|nr:class F sortase [Amycolatopsis arida]
MLAVAAVAAGVLVLVRPWAAPPEPTAPPPAAAPLVEPPAATTSAPVRQVAAQRPGTVRLPEGGTATLVRRELTADGTLPIPDSLGEATWWGAELGAGHGAALLSGHVNWNRRKGPFDELWRIRSGQEVIVLDTAGGRWVYRVTDVLTLHKDELPAHAQRLFGQDGPHRLVLVTCGGDYVGGTDGYRDNRIVTAELVSRP